MISMTRRLRTKGLAFDVKGWDEVYRRAFLRAAGWYYYNIMPKHFTPAGSAEYGYQNSSKGYRSFKTRMIEKGIIPGPYLPLVLSGLTRTHITKGIPDIRFRVDRASLMLHPPRYIWMSPGKGINKARELTTVSKRDEEAFAKVFAQALREEIKRNNASATERQSAMSGY